MRVAVFGIWSHNRCRSCLVVYGVRVDLLLAVGVQEAQPPINSAPNITPSLPASCSELHFAGQAIAREPKPGLWTLD